MFTKIKVYMTQQVMTTQLKEKEVENDDKRNRKTHSRNERRSSNRT